MRRPELPGAAKVAAPDLAAGTFALGAWCSVQRGLYRKGLLAAERAAELEGLPGWLWQPRDERWWTSLDALADYVEHHHGMYPPRAQEWRGVRVEPLAAAVVDVEVVDTTGLADHHAVVARFDREMLWRILG